MPNIVSDERKSQTASPVETPSNEIQTSYAITLVNDLEAMMNGTYETESESLAMEAVSDIVKLKITQYISSIFSTYEEESESLAIEDATNFISSIIANETDPIAKRNMFDVLSVIIRKERAKFLLGIYSSCFSSLGKTDQLEILMLVKSQMEDEGYENTGVMKRFFKGPKYSRYSLVTLNILLIFLDFQKETIGTGSAYVRPKSTTQEGMINSTARFIQ